MAMEYCTISPDDRGWLVTFPGGHTHRCGSNQEAKAIATIVNSWIGFQSIGRPESPLEVDFLREWHRRLSGYGIESYAAEIKTMLEEAERRIGDEEDAEEQ